MRIDPGVAARVTRGCGTASAASSATSPGSAASAAPTAPPGAVPQHAVRRARRRPGEPVGGRGPDPLRVGAELLEHRARQPVPRRLAARRSRGRCRRVRPRRPAGRARARPRGSRWARRPGRRRRRGCRLGLQGRHGADEVAARARRRATRCARRRTASGSSCRTACSPAALDRPYADRGAQRGVLGVRRGGGAVEDVVGGDVHQPGPLGGAGGREQLRAEPVDAGRLGLVLLGAVDVGPGGGVDDDVVTGDRRRDRGGVGDVEVGARDRGHLGAAGGQDVDHVAAEHAARAGDEPPHRRHSVPVGSVDTHGAAV